MNSSESLLSSHANALTSSDPAIPEHLKNYADAVAGLRQAGHQFWSRGWSLGTSSNYSVLVEKEPLTLLLTASGKDKGHLQAGDFVLVDEAGTPTLPDQPKSSAETLLHCLAVKKCQAGAVLHTHSVWSTILSEHYFSLRGLRIEGFEMLKGLEGVTTHETTFWLPIFDNTQDIPALASEVSAYLDANPNQLCVGYLIRQHGLYTWGKDLPSAVRHMEVIEFLLECIGRKTKL
ncbi:methylthioribulose 1-phosphate dehydratase [Pirellulaceae bacterium SH449]